MKGLTERVEAWRGVLLENDVGSEGLEWLVLKIEVTHGCGQTRKMDDDCGDDVE